MGDVFLLSRRGNMMTPTAA